MASKLQHRLSRLCLDRRWNLPTVILYPTFASSCTNLRCHNDHKAVVDSGMWWWDKAGRSKKMRRIWLWSIEHIVSFLYTSFTAASSPRWGNAPIWRAESNTRPSSPRDSVAAWIAPWKSCTRSPCSPSATTQTKSSTWKKFFKTVTKSSSSWNSKFPS